MTEGAQIVTAAVSSIATQRVKKAWDLLTQARTDEAITEVQKAATIEEAVAIADHAHNLELLAKRLEYAEGAEADAFYIKQFARRRIGQLTALLPKDKGGRPPKAPEPGPNGETVETRPASGQVTTKSAELLRLKIPRQRANEYERMARVPEDEFKAQLDRTRAEVEKKSAPTSIMRRRGPVDRDSYGTPEPYAAAMHELFDGPPDLDPASNPMANNVIRARKFYTKDDSGLAVIWRAETLWMNSPFSGALVKQFQGKFIAEFEAGHFKQGLSLVNADTSVSWFQELMQRFPVCFPNERIAFLHPETGEPVKGNEYPQAIFYAGPQRERFREIFSRFGIVMVRMPETITAA